MRRNLRRLAGLPRGESFRTGEERGKDTGSDKSPAIFTAVVLYGLFEGLVAKVGAGGESATTLFNFSPHFKGIGGEFLGEGVGDGLGEGCGLVGGGGGAFLVEEGDVLRTFARAAKPGLAAASDALSAEKDFDGSFWHFK